MKHLHPLQIVRKCVGMRVLRKNKDKKYCFDEKTSVKARKKSNKRQKNSIVRKMRNFSGKRGRRVQVLCGWQSTSWPRPRGAERPGMPSSSCADDKKSLPHGREGRTRARAGLARKPGRRGQVLCGWQSTPWPRPRGMLLTGSARPAQAASRRAMPGPRRGSTHTRRPSRAPGRIDRPHP